MNEYESLACISHRGRRSFTARREARGFLYDGRASLWRRLRGSGRIVSDLLWAVGGIAAICRRRGDASGEAGCGQAPFVGVGTGGGGGEIDAARTGADQGAALVELEA